MSQQYFIADVFTDKAFSGAQIAVFPQAESMDEDRMQLLARELNLTETVFVTKSDSAEVDYQMRIFTPLTEVKFAGHPIIATAYALVECGEIDTAQDAVKLIMRQPSGDVEVNITLQDGKVSLVQFSQKVSSVIDRFTPSDSELAEFLGLEVNDLDHKKYSTRLVSAGFPYLVVPVWRYESVRKAKFNFAAWSQSAAPQTAAQEILLFAPKSPYQDANFNARLLGPNIGPNDDPPVGTAMPAFASYLCSFDFTQLGTHTFAVDRGDLHNRRSVINIEMDHKAQSDLNLRIGGGAVLVAEGKMLL